MVALKSLVPISSLTRRHRIPIGWLRDWTEDLTRSRGFSDLGGRGWLWRCSFGLGVGGWLWSYRGDFFFFFFSWWYPFLTRRMRGHLESWSRPQWYEVTGEIFLNGASTSLCYMPIYYQCFQTSIRKQLFCYYSFEQWECAYCPRWDYREYFCDVTLNAKLYSIFRWGGGGGFDNGDFAGTMGLKIN